MPYFLVYGVVDVAMSVVVVVSPVEVVVSAVDVVVLAVLVVEVVLPVPTMTVRVAVPTFPAWSVAVYSIVWVPSLLVSICGFVGSADGTPSTEVW